MPPGCRRHLFAAPEPADAVKGGRLPNPIYPPTYGMTDAAGVRFRFIQAGGLYLRARRPDSVGHPDAAAVKGGPLNTVRV
jgi:hypothetical protein